MAEITQPQEVEIDAKQGRIKVRGSDVLTTIGIAIVVLVGYMVWEHKEESKVTQQTFVQAVREMTQSHQQGVKEQRVMNCLIATPDRERETRLSTCERIAR